MLINTLNILTEISLYLLLLAITFSNSATEIFTASIIAFFIIKRIALREFRLPKTRINILLYMLCAIIFITFLRSAYFSESIRGLVRVLKFVFLYFALVEFFTGSEKRINRVFWVIMIVACFTFLNGIFQYIFGFDFLRHHGLMDADYLRRIFASFVHPNDFAAYIILILPLTLCFFAPGVNKWRRAFLIINCLLGLYCLLKTSSRAAWLGFLIGIIIYFFFYKKKISIIVPLAVVLFVIFSPNGFDRLKNLFLLEHNTVWERMELWKGTWNMIKVHPFFGFGVNTFSRYFVEYKPVEYHSVRYTHNSYLQMWSEIGIFGLATFVAVIFTVLMSGLRNIRKKLSQGIFGFMLLGVACGYIAFLIQSGLDTNLFSLILATFFWIMTAYLVSINKLVEEKTL